MSNVDIEREALNRTSNWIPDNFSYSDMNVRKVLSNALEELDQFREKAKPKYVRWFEDECTCPNCHNVIDDDNALVCEHCYQKIDWSEGE